MLKITQNIRLPPRLLLPSASNIQRAPSFKTRMLETVCLRSAILRTFAHHCFEATLASKQFRPHSLHISIMLFQKNCAAFACCLGLYRWSLSCVFSTHHLFAALSQSRVRRLVDGNASSWDIVLVEIQQCLWHAFGSFGKRRC